MKKHVLTAIALIALAPAAMAVTYNDNITAIFGSSNPDTGWTSETGNGIELALRAKGRNGTPYAGSTANVNGVYTFATQVGARGPFNYEFSINSGTPTLSFYDYYLAVDRDPSQGATYSVVNPLSHWIDNSYGSSATANGAGIEGTSALAAANFIAQNSQNITFGDYPGGALALLSDATYSYTLYAVASGAGASGSRLASVSIDVVIGNGGGRAVPDAGSTLALLGVGIAGLAAVRRKLA